MSLFAPRLLAAVTALLLMLPATGSATNYYVRPSGDDENAGTSAAEAFATIARAAQLATNGDTVYVATGTYTDPIYVLGAKNSTNTLRFVADTTGYNTASSAGRVVISSAALRVAGSNYVEVEGFVFDGGSAFPVIWEGSYEGKISDCTFTGGERSLIMTAGSLSLEGCTFSDFQDDAIQVDGSARLTVRECTITNSGGHAIDIRKNAIAEVISSTISDSVANGLNVDIQDDSIAIPEITAEECECVGTSPLNLKQQAYDILASLSPEDEVFAHVIDSAARDVQEATDDKLWRDEWHVDIPAGPNVFEQTIEAVTKLNAVLSDDVDFEIIGDIIKVKHPFVAEVTVIGAAISSGSTPVPVTMKFSVDGQTFEPFGDYDTASSGNVNDNNNPRTYETTETFQEDDEIIVTGRSWSTSGSSVIMTVDSNSRSENVYTLRDGDDVPDIQGFNGQASAVEFLQPYITDDKVTLAENQVILLYELGTTNLNSSAADFQDLVVLVTLKKSHESTALTDDEIAKIKQAIALLMESDDALANCALDEATQGGGDSDAVAEGEKYYVNAQSLVTQEKLEDASNGFLSAWEHAKKSTGGIDIDPHAILASNIQAVPPSGWTAVLDGHAEVSGSKFTGNAIGVAVLSAKTFAASSSEFSGNDTWGVSLYGQFKMESCTMSSNGTGGLRLSDLDDGDFGFASLTLADNVEYGVFFDNCRLNFDSSLYSGWTISGSKHVLGSNAGALGLDGITITGGTVAGVYTYQGVLTIDNCVFSANTYGVMSSESEASISNSKLNSNVVGLFANANVTVKVDGVEMDSNYVGLYGSQNGTMTVANSDITSSTLWGVIISDPTVKATFDTCVVSGGPHGFYAATVNDGELELKDTEIKDNTTYGLHFEACQLTLGDPATEGWSTLRNGYGISANNSTLTLTSPQVDQSTLYGLYFTASTVNVNGGIINSVNGVYLGANNTDFVANGTKLLNTSGSGTVGLTHLGGNSTVRDSLVKGFTTGASLQSSAGQSALENVTLVGIGTTGVSVTGGNVSVKNTIVTGNGATGLAVTGGSVSHNNNIVHGFTTAFSGTTMHASESTKTPRFADAAAGDYRLSPASPAINAGVDLGLANPTDMDGNSRPSFHGFEIGAYEYMSDNSSFRVLDWQETQ